MSDSGFASLGPSLLARKGGAKPAMRPQVAPLVTGGTPVAEEQLEDLGWNDMGDSDLPAGADIVPINPGLSPDRIAMGEGPIVRRQQRRLEERVLADAAMTGPEDRDPEYDEDEGYGDEDDANGPLYGEEYEDEALGAGACADAATFSSPPAPEPVAPSRNLHAPAPAAAKARVAAAQGARRAAFTLRLDADRHLKLRLAATMQGVSAQALVTEALDRLLAEHGELDVIANHLKRH